MIIFIVFAVVGFISLAAILTQSSIKNKGKIGEKIVIDELKSCNKYLINDLLFIDNEGRSRQIDHVYVNQYGIHVVETKNYSGSIFGKENQRQWTQVLAYGNVKNFFYNPLKQNEAHIYGLSNKLNMPRKLFHNLVVFPDHTDISGISSQSVCHIKDLLSQLEIGSVTIPSEKIELIFNKISSLKEGKEIELREHIENTRALKLSLKQGFCPRCNGKLVIRNGKYGQFYACSNYPRCKFTINKNTFKRIK